MEKKFYFLTVAMIFIINISYCQTYLNNTTQWKLFSGSENIVISLVHTNVRVIDEVSINDTMYYELEYSSIDSIYNLNWEFVVAVPTDFPTNRYLYIREEDKKFYLRKSLIEEEILYMDFNLEVGDTVPNYYETYWDTTIFVTSIDTLSSGQLSRKRYHTNYEALKIIEGVGNNAYLNLVWSPNETQLVCYSINGESLLIDSTKNCDLDPIVSFSEIEVPKPAILISPNPFRDFVTIKFSPILIGECELSLFNSTGQLVYYRRIIDTSNIVLDRGNLLNGIYFLKIKINNSDEYIEKLVVLN